MTDPYSGREQTKAKHFILKRYLQALAFKVLTFSDITYVDGFSGPWETKTENFSDSSFMIAITVLKDAQARFLQQRGMADLFAEQEVAAQDETTDEIVQRQMALASDELLATLAQAPLEFSKVVVRLIQPYMLRETNVKDICVELARKGKIDRTWKTGQRKPRDGDIIRLTS